MPTALDAAGVPRSARPHPTIDPPCERGIAMNRGIHWISIGAISGALAVILGAFGAHGIAPTEESLNAMSPPQRKIIERRLANYETAARYHLVHSLAIVGVGLTAI